MNIKKLRDKGIAALITIAFMALIRTNAAPSLWQVALIAIGFYECALIGIRTVRQQRRDARIIENNRQRRIEGMRLEMQRFDRARKVG